MRARHVGICVYMYICARIHICTHAHARVLTYIACACVSVRVCWCPLSPYHPLDRMVKPGIYSKYMHAQHKHIRTRTPIHVAHACVLYAYSFCACGVGPGACDDLPPTGCRERITRLYPGGKAIAPISVGTLDRDDTCVPTSQHLQRRG